MTRSNDNEFFPPPPAIERAPCAFCGKPTDPTLGPGPAPAGEFAYSESHQVTVQWRANMKYHPPGKPDSAEAQGILRTFTCDICPECFDKWLLPWFEQNGVEARRDEQSWGAESPFSHPRDL